MSKIAFLGAGNIAQAFMGGLKDKYSNMIASDPATASRDKAAALGVTVTEDNNEAVSPSDIVMLCVKPDVLPDLLKSLTFNDTNKLFISVAAGVTTTTITQSLTQPSAVVRCMPNTPALVGKGMTAMFAAPGTSTDQKGVAEEILSAVGETIWVQDETDLDAVTAVSGSGPAYFFLMMEAMVEAGISAGLGAETARKLVLQTALGSSTMAASSEFEPAELRRQVTSPGGTTEAALNELNAGGFSELVSKAVDAAKSRAAELSQS